MEHKSQGYTTSDRCPRINIHKVKKLVKGNTLSVKKRLCKKKSAKNLVGKKISHLAKISHFLPPNFLF